MKTLRYPLVCFLKNIKKRKKKCKKNDFLIRFYYKKMKIKLNIIKIG